MKILFHQAVRKGLNDEQDVDIEHNTSHKPQNIHIGSNKGAISSGNKLFTSSFGIDDFGDMRISEKSIVAAQKENTKLTKFYECLNYRVAINQKLIR